VRMETYHRSTEPLIDYYRAGRAEAVASLMRLDHVAEQKARQYSVQ